MVGENTKNATQHPECVYTFFSCLKITRWRLLKLFHCDFKHELKFFTLSADRERQKRTGKKVTKPV